jgi:two-component system chemotaxis response regulator CheY
MEFDQNIFFDEFNNKIVSLNNALVDLKSGDYSDEVINGMFRDIHTIKSTSDLLGMFSLVDVTHKAEDLLDLIRTKKFSMNDDICSLFIEFKDYISLTVRNISMGIFDDEVVESLTIYFEKEFNYYLQEARNDNSENKLKKTILVVEDSTIIRYMIKKIALDNGYNIFITDNGEDGYKKIENHDIDIIICDLATQNIGVQKMITKVKQNIQYDQLPIIMLVNYMNNSLIEYGKKIGATAWLTKPIKNEKLLMMLNKIA